MQRLCLLGRSWKALRPYLWKIKEILRDILHRRIIERRREELVQDVQQAQQEFQAGACRSVTPEELMNEIMP